jgi:hypothetical protein
MAMRKTVTIMLIAISALAGGVLGHYMEQHRMLGTIVGCLYGRHTGADHDDGQRSEASRGWL